MTATLIDAERTWELEIDEEGHRTYSIDWQVRTSSIFDGPDIALTAAGLPLPGSSLSLGNTVDPWAFYQRKGSARLKRQEAHGRIWTVNTIFTTKPARRCQTDQITDPLLEPHRVRGGFNKFTEEIQQDNAGNPLSYSNGQRIRGPAAQVPRSRPTVELEMNVAWLDLPFLAEYVEAVNDDVWWTMTARKIKCTDFTWERFLYGTCNFYFKVNFSFELNDKTWDLSVLDEGLMTKIPGSNPPRYIQAKDQHEENVMVLLDGAGNALTPGDPEVFLNKRVCIEKDFSAVGWPTLII